MFYFRLLTTGVFITVLLACNNVTQISSSDSGWTENERYLLGQLHISRLPHPVDQTNKYSNSKQAAQLGRQLFFDSNLSANNKVSCASCHDPEQYFTDGLKTAKGVMQTRRNAPTIVGASHQVWFFHDGRADSLWSQALGPLENSKEHATNRNAIAHYIYSDTSLKKQYESIFGKLPDLSNIQRFPLNASPIGTVEEKKNWLKMSKADQLFINKVFVNIGKSLAAFETLIQPTSSRVDNYIDAVLNANKKPEGLSDSELRGMRLFIGKANCILCHSGPLLTDNLFHNVATVDINNKPYDLGRYPVIKSLLDSPFNCRGEFNDKLDDPCNELKYISTDEHQTTAAFKTPGLRNVSKTAPYMHDGQFESLEDVLQHYAKPDKLIIGQKDLLPVTLSEKDQKDLVAFLKALDSPVVAH